MTLLWAYLARLHRDTGWRFPLAAVLMVLSGLAEGLGFLLLVPLLQRVGLSGEDEAALSPLPAALDHLLAQIPLGDSLLAVLLIFTIVSLLRLALTSARDLLTHSLVLEFLDGLRRQMFASLAKADWLMLSRCKPGEIANSLSRDLDRVGQGTFYLFQLSTTAAMVIIQLAIAFAISPPIMLVTLGLLLVAVLVVMPRIKKAQALGGHLSDERRLAMAQLGEFTQSLKLIKSLSAEQSQIERFGSAVDNARGLELAFHRSSVWLRALFGAIATIGLAILVFAGLRLLNLASAELLLLVALFARMTPMIATAQRGIYQLAFMLPAFAKAMQLEENCQQAREYRPIDPQESGWPSAGLQQGIELIDVGFAYSGACHRQVLSGICLRIGAKETVAIIGPSGAGKTTLADLFLGLLTPNQGEIRIDGVSLDCETQWRWRQRVAYVPQDAFLFHDSLRANLLTGRPDADEAALWQALQDAAARDFVQALPQGLDTIVGERGLALSGGERQRITLARALLRDPLLIVFDEATSALDPQSCRQIETTMQALRGKVAQIIVSHQTGHLRAADRIIRLEQGQIQTITIQKHQSYLS